MLNSKQAIILIFRIVAIIFFLSSANVAASEITLDEKLLHQFDLYGKAREKIIQRVAVENQWVDRNEWTSWLKPEPNYELSEKDKKELRNRHDSIVFLNKIFSDTNSIFDLDSIRNDKNKVRRFCSEFPKGGLLHIHPSGTRKSESVREMLLKVNPVVDGKKLLIKANNNISTILYENEIHFLETLEIKKFTEYNQKIQKKIIDLFFLPLDPPSHDFKRFEAIFAINSLLFQNPDKTEWVIEKTYMDFLERAIKQKVYYVEFTSTIDVDKETMDNLKRLAEKFYKEIGVMVRWNLAFRRTGDPNENYDLTLNAIDFFEKNTHEYLVGIDLLANETNTPALENGQSIYIPVLHADNLQKINLHRTMHAGELGDPSNVRDAMIMGSERVGHGVLLNDQIVALEYARDVVKLPIEINLVSNYRLGVIALFNKHPFLYYLRLGLPVSLSTDDEGMFHTDINTECEVAVSNTDITYDELVAMSYNSIETSFASDIDKQTLLDKLDREFLIFETKMNELMQKKVVESHEYQ
ncbi:MAG: hypothetical protein GY874_08355 [Desulfobacteraceae bacterium]|nr:hypothetical protein [Desulfobacteraceae bacterium]